MRLIDADALKDRLEDLRSYTALNKEQAYYRGETNALKIAIRSVKNAPTVDAVPVVRCKDCKHAHLTYDGDCKYCQLDIDRDFTEETYRNGDWFCADGERMATDDE